MLDFAIHSMLSPCNDPHNTLSKFFLVYLETNGDYHNSIITSDEMLGTVDLNRRI